MIEKKEKERGKENEQRKKNIKDITIHTSTFLLTSS
jgi:hypothetical protein